MKKITTFCFLLLATLPLLKENFNSIIIILCCILTIIHYFSNSFKKKIVPALIYTIPFWFVLLYELISGSFSFKETNRWLPFLIFPLLFYYKPVYINEDFKKKSITVFQISVILQCFIYTILFCINNPTDKLFYISPENIPFFRNYVSNNYFFTIHPTYFSTYLLVSCTFSLKDIVVNKNYQVIYFLNIFFMIFYISLFSSKIIFISLIITFLLFFSYYIKNNSSNKIVYSLIIFLMILLFYPSKNNIIYKRFNEIKTEYNKPIVGDYHNSVNIRMAVIKCSVSLIEELPLFGYRNKLQSQLNECYKQNNKSDFYKISTYNSHNYYIHLLLYGGWVYLLMFLVYLGFIFNKIKNSLIGVILLAQFLIINLTENFFSRHYGIVLFSYIITFLIFIDNNDDSKLENIQTTKKL